MNLNTDKNNAEMFKIVLIGETSVGKTSIISQFVEKTFQYEQQSTTGGTFSSKTVKCSNNKILNLEIWDTAGQERYRSITKMFYKDANAVILVYDITKKESFEQLNIYWAKQVQELCPSNVIFAVAANKADLLEDEQVTEEEGREFAKSLNAIFAVTSAKNKAGIEKIFLEIAKKYTGYDAVLVDDTDDLNEFRDMRKDTFKFNKNNYKGNEKKKCC